MVSTRINKLEHRCAQLKARIEAVQARDRERQRREDTRRKILAGAVVLRLAKEQEGFGRWLKMRLGERLMRADERKLFDLRPTEEKSEG